MNEAMKSASMVVRFRDHIHSSHSFSGYFHASGSTPNHAFQNRLSGQHTFPGKSDQAVLCP